MKVIYAGKSAELAPAQRTKLDQKFQKLGKLLDRKGEKEARVMLNTERHIHHTEITVQYYDHQIVGYGADPDVVNSIADAIDKLEKQILKQQTKWRDSKRGTPRDQWPDEEPSAATDTNEEEAAAIESEDGETRRVFRVDRHQRRKPMTLEEAMMTIDERPYLVYRDAEKDCVSVLIRRPDGNYDLIEG